MNRFLTLLALLPVSLALNFAAPMRPALRTVASMPQPVLKTDYTGAGIASSFAARYPDRVAGIIMHGPPCFTQDEVSSFQKKGPSNITRTPS